MTAGLTLGAVPLPLELNLDPRGGFHVAIDREDGVDWPDGSQVQLAFDGGVSWPAELDGPRATWSVSETDVAELLASGRRSVRLLYIDAPGDDPIVWFRGRIV